MHLMIDICIYLFICLFMLNIHYLLYYLGLSFKGPAVVFDSEEDMLHALEKGEIKKGNVVIIRYEGPKGKLIR